MAKRHIKRKKKARAGFLVGAALLVLAILVLAAVLLSVSSCDREAEPEPATDAMRDGGWYRDDLDCIGNDEALVRGMEIFEKKTGVRPYLTLLDGVEPEELDMFAQDQYEALFSDGGHLLVVYDEWEEGTYYLTARAGEGSGLSQQSVAKILSCLETAYADPANETFADAFGTGFRQAAGEVSVKSSRNGVGLLLFLGLFLIALSAALVLTLRKRSRTAARWDEEDS